MQFTVDQILSLLYTNFLVVGPPKTGKTQSTTTLRKLKSRPWVQGKKLYYYDFDEGMQPVIRIAVRDKWADEIVPFRYAQVGGDRISRDAIPQRSPERFTDFLSDINRLYDHVTSDGKRWKDDFIDQAPYAIVVDSLTVIQFDILNFTLSLRHKELGDEKVHGGAEYGFQMGKIVETIRSIKKLPCFSVWLAHEQTKMGTVKMPTPPPRGNPINPVTTGIISKLPVVTGTLAETIGGEFGAVLFTKIEPVTSTTAKYLWETRPNGEIRSAGSRLKENLDALIPQDFNLVVD